MSESEYEGMYRGYTIVVEHDDDPMSPDELGWGLPSAFLTSIHRQFYVPFPSEVNGKNLHLNWWKLPLYAYIHSGVMLSITNKAYPFNDQWDACQIGWLYVKRGKLKAPVLAKAIGIAAGLVAAWNDYLNGNCWSVFIRNEKDEIIDSVSGYYGDPGELIAEGQNIIDGYFEHGPELAFLHEILATFPSEEEMN